MYDLSPQFIKQMIHAMGEGMYTLDTDGNCTFINPEGERLLGWSMDELIGKNLHEIIHSQTADGQFLPRHECPTYKSVSEGRLYRSDSEVFRQKNGTIFPVSLVSEALYIDDKLQGSVAVFRDLSTSKQVELELAKAQHQVEIATQLKNNFLANMSHELRTPLNAINGLTHLSLQTPLNETQTDYLEKIEQASHNLLKLINDILDFSRAESGRMEISEKKFNLASVFDDLEKQMAGKIEQTKLQIKLSLSPETKLIRLGDATKLKKILFNLACNAIKFTPKGIIQVSASSLVHERDKILFKVCDTGIGMSKEQVEQLFSNFVQLDSSASRKKNGLGLGLSYSQKICQLLGGQIQVKSQYGKGSEFYFTLQLPYVDDTSQQLNKPHVLLVEDNKINLKVSKSILTKMQIDVTTCEDGQQALDILSIKNRHFDLVLMDVQMPIMNGIEATKRIRRIDSLHTLPIIALTASEEVEEVQSCFMAGMNAHLLKPIKLDNLTSILNKWLDGSFDQFEKKVSSATALKVEFSSIDGLNTRKALLQLSNNTSLYQQLLHDFYVNYKDFSIPFKSLISDKDSAERKIHSIKSVAANIGAEELAKISNTLETAIPKGEVNSDLLTHFSEQLKFIINALINSGYSTNNDNITDSTFDENKDIPSKNDIRANLEQLRIYLRSYDGSSEDYFMNNKTLYLASYPSKEVDNLKNAIKQFDFDSAITIISTWIEQL